MSHIEKLRETLLKRGVEGIYKIGRTFTEMDSDTNKVLKFEEFKNGLEIRGVGLDEEGIKALFNECDEDKSGTLNYEEFLEKLRPPLNDTRLNCILKAFACMDKTGDGVITVEDLKGIYNVKYHPKYQNGEFTEDQVLAEFLSKFEVKSDDKDSKITKEEWINYYSGVSASIDKDVYFTLMLGQSYKF